MAPQEGFNPRLDGHSGFIAALYEDYPWGAALSTRDEAVVPPILR